MEHGKSDGIQSQRHINTKTYQFIRQQLVRRTTQHFRQRNFRTQIQQRVLDVEESAKNKTQPPRNTWNGVHTRRISESIPRESVKCRCSARSSHRTKHEIHIAYEINALVGGSPARHFFERLQRHGGETIHVCGHHNVLCASARVQHDEAKHTR